MSDATIEGSRKTFDFPGHRFCFEQGTLRHAKRDFAQLEASKMNPALNPPRRSLSWFFVTLGAVVTVATGCGDGDEPAASEPDVTVTWHEHIAPLVTEKCAGCHNQDGIGPFSIETYDEAHMWAQQMNREIQSGAMPPWAAQETEECSPPAPFKDDLRLTDAEKALFAEWIDDGRLEGDPADAAQIPEPPKLELQDPDRSLTIPSDVTVEGTSDTFVCFTLDPEITQPVWLTGTQVVAGNSSVAHHALLYLDRTGEGAQLANERGQYPCFGGPQISSPSLLAAWAPGSVPALTPDNTGTPLEPGDKLIVQMHYHPTGAGPEVDDSTRIDLKWTTEEPDFVSNIFLIGNFENSDRTWQGGPGYGLTTGPEFLIPAGARDHEEENRYLLPDDGDDFARIVPLYLWGVGTHMHYVGTDMKITIESPEGDERCLVQTPNWDFNWQRAYFFEGEVDDMPEFHLGDSLTMRCTYDNSLENPFVREALDEQGLEEPVDVVLGDESLDEMCLGVFGVATPKEFKEAIGL